MTLDPGRKLGPYEIVGPLGAGGMGEVYRARDPRLGRDVAIKVLPAGLVKNADRLRRFEQEAKAAGRLNHPGLTAVYDVGSIGEIPYVVQELLEGETLRSELAGSGLPPRKAIDYALQIARGLAAAHDAGIVHRDLKPENIFVTRDGRVKVLDFGLAKLLRAGDGDEVTSLPTETAGTEPGAVLGTIAYMSPEQVKGQPADARSDIFAFGAVLHEMITGRRAFAAGSPGETMAAILKEEPPDLTATNQSLPPGLDRIVRHCLEKSPQRRFQSAHDLAFDLESVSATSAVGAIPSPAGIRRDPLSRRFTAGLVAGAAIAGLAAAAFLALGPRSDRPAPATYSQITFRQGSLASARLTPDGETVIYGAAWEGTPVELYSTRPGSPESRSLGLTSAEILSVSRSGEMAVLLNPRIRQGFERTGTLSRAPIAGGVPRPMLEDVQAAAWEVGGSGLTVSRVVDDRYRLEYPIGTVLYDTDGWIGSVRFSRDGRRIAFLDHPLRADSRGRAAMVDLSGTMTPLTEMFSSTMGLAWSPSGDEVWFTAGRTGNVQALLGVDLSGALRVVDGAPASMTLQDVSPSGRVLLTRENARRGLMALAPGEQNERDLSWLDWSRVSDISPDGQWVLFEEQGQGGGAAYSVYLRRTDGSPAVKLGSGFSAGLSPDGQWAATVPVDNPDRMILVPRGAGEPRVLDIPQPATVNAQARWIPGTDRIVTEVIRPGELPRFHVLDPGGGAPVPFGEAGPYTFTWALSPDGTMVAASLHDAEPVLQPLDGGPRRPIPGSVKGDLVLRWSADGRGLFVRAGNDLPARIFRIDVRSGQRAPWKDLLPADKAGLVDITYIALSGDGESYAYSYRRVLATLYVVEGLL